VEAVNAAGVAVPDEVVGDLGVHVAPLAGLGDGGEKLAVVQEFDAHGCRSRD
jgi:hypothetical protein